MDTKIYILNTSSLNDDSVFDNLYHTVSPNRQKKIMNYYFRKDRNLSLGAGLLLKKGLSEYGLEESAMTYIMGHNQKPQLAEYPDIHFNLSHSEEMVICTFSPTETGCDIEKITDIDLNIAKKFFFNSEYQYINSQLSSNERCNAFFRLWTLKESFMKITGLGMSLPLDSFCIYFDDDRINIHQSVDSQSYFFHEYDCISGYKIACCSHNNTFAPTPIICLDHLILI